MLEREGINMNLEIKKKEGTNIVSLYLPVKWVDKIDELRGQTSRNEFIKNLISQQILEQA